MVTDPAQWPESLPVDTFQPVFPAKLIETDSIGYENLEKATHLAWNWSNPWYCWDELVRLGFTTAELGPRPQSEFPDTDFGPSPDEEEPDDEGSTD